MALSGELRELLDHHGARRHVDPERERLGREDDLGEAGGERLLDRLLHRRHHPRVVGRETRLESGEPRVVPEHRQIVVVQPLDVRFGDPADLARAPRLSSGGRRPRGTARPPDRSRLRLKTNTIAGRRLSSARSSTTSTRRRRPEPPGAARAAPRPAAGAAVEALGLGVRSQVVAGADERREEVEMIVAALPDQVAVVQLDRAGVPR